MNLRLQLVQTLNLVLTVSTAFMGWKGLAFLTNAELPVVVVLTGLMEPAFQRGDLLFLWNRNHRSEVGDVVVYNMPGRPIPIVHRVLREHHNNDKQLLLTKGDNNPIDDLSLYRRGQMYLDKQRDIMGTVYGYLPMVGYVTILITENQYFKFAMLGLMGLSAVLQQE